MDCYRGCKLLAVVVAGVQYKATNCVQPLLWEVHAGVSASITSLSVNYNRVTNRAQNVLVMLRYLCVIMTLTEFSSTSHRGCSCMRRWSIQGSPANRRRCDHNGSTKPSCLIRYESTCLVLCARGAVFSSALRLEKCSPLLAPVTCQFFVPRSPKPMYERNTEGIVFHMKR